FVAGRKRVPNPAAGIIAFLTFIRLFLFNEFSYIYFIISVLSVPRTIDTSIFSQAFDKIVSSYGIPWHTKNSYHYRIRRSIAMKERSSRVKKPTKYYFTT